MATTGAKGGSNFLAAQINQRNCGHDNYHPMARSSVTPFPCRRLRPTLPPPLLPLAAAWTALRRGINHEKQFRTSRASRLDAALSMLMMPPSSPRQKSRAFINNKSEPARERASERAGSRELQARSTSSRMKWRSTARGIV